MRASQRIPPKSSLSHPISRDSQHPPPAYTFTETTSVPARYHKYQYRTKFDPYGSVTASQALREQSIERLSIDKDPAYSRRFILRTFDHEIVETTEKINEHVRERAGRTVAPSTLGSILEAITSLPRSVAHTLRRRTLLRRRSKPSHVLHDKSNHLP